MINRIIDYFFKDIISAQQALYTNTPLNKNETYDILKLIMRINDNELAEEIIEQKEILFEPVENYHDRLRDYLQKKYDAIDI